jgi:uncharacterized phage-associated protein
MYDVVDISKQLIKIASADKDCELTPLKLQKIMYFAQGYYLVWKNKPFYYNRIEAWKYGPVIPQLYHYLKEYGSEDLCNHDLSTHTIDNIDSETKGFLSWIWTTFKDYKAIELVNITHLHKPWIDGMKRQDSLISNNDIQYYFKKKYKL